MSLEDEVKDVVSYLTLLDSEDLGEAERMVEETERLTESLGMLCLGMMDRLGITVHDVGLKAARTNWTEWKGL